MEKLGNEDDDKLLATASVKKNTNSESMTAATSTPGDFESTNEEEKKESTGDMTLYLAKDGVYYNSYMEQRAANIRCNENKLRSVGLGGTFRLEKKSSSRSPSVPKKRSLLNRDDDDTPRRKSGRLRQKQQLQPSTSSSSQTNPSPALLEELPIDDDNRNIRKKKPKGKSISTSTTMTTNTLATNDRQILQTYEVTTPLWVQDMELYLKDVEHLSHPNYRSVMRQVEKLVTGIGITYTHWEEDVYFHRKAPISLSDDMDNLYNEALEFEIEHGRDLGNGMCIFKIFFYLPFSFVCSICTFDI